MPFSFFRLFIYFALHFIFFLSPFSISFFFIYFFICFLFYFISISSCALLAKRAATYVLAVARFSQDRYCYAYPTILAMGILVVALFHVHVLLLLLYLQRGFRTRATAI